MQFSLKTLLLATAVLPPAAWLIYKTLWRFAGDEPLTLPDPIGTLGVAAWIAIYYNCVHKRLPNS
jgi:hypothetical protein